MRIVDFLSRKAIIASLEASSKEEALAELAEPILRQHRKVNKAGMIQTLLERENLGSTGIGGGVAIPHGKLEGLDHLAGSFGRSVQGVDFSSMDDRPAHLFFLLVAPLNSASDHLKALARISRLFKDPFFKDSLKSAESADEIYDLLEEWDLRVP